MGGTEICRPRGFTGVWGDTMQKYEREIEDLLQKLETEDSQGPRPMRRDRPPQLPRPRPTVVTPVRNSVRNVHVGAGHLMIAGLALLFASRMLPGAAAEIVAVAGVLLFLWPIVGSMLTGGAPREETRWRGRTIDADENSWGDVRSRLEDGAREFKRRFSRRRP